MVAPIYSNKKGIYKDLYREIDSENNKKKKTNEKSQLIKPKKGIYRELYKQIELEKTAFKNNEKHKKKNFLLILQKMINTVFSRMTSFFSATRGEIKMLIAACVIAKKPIKSYIENYVVGAESPAYNKESKQSGITIPQT